MKKALTNFLKFLLFLSVGLVILYWVYQKQNAAYQAECELKGIAEADCSLLQKVLTDFASADYFWLLMVLLCFTISNISRAVRWNMLLRQLGFMPRLINGFLTIILGYFANLGLPRVGEVVRAGTMARYEKIPVEKVMGTVVVDRVIDVISILLVTALALALEFDTLWAFLQENNALGEKLSENSTLLIGLALLGVLGLVGLYLMRKRLQQTKLYQKISGILMGFVEGLQTISKLDKPFLFVLHSINIWLMYFLMTYVCFFAFEPTAHLSASIALVVFVFGGWGIVIPSPGGMGTYHFLATTALGFYGIAGDDGFSWSNISFFTIQIGCNISIGILALILLPVINRSTADGSPPDEEAAIG
ncbi:MAG: lysylphosphatidylglycerol synthase transmembrane domain-containing protein [Bacteroidota bacterium]